MKITVSLDSQAVIVQPSPLRIKAGAFVPVAIAFTRASQTVSLAQGAVIEFALKPRNQWTGGLLAYLNSFEVTAGNIYTGTLNCASASLLGALGISDSTPLNDIPQIEASAEVTWSFGGQKFRSSTFPLIVETPLTDDNPIPTPDPELYPNPAAIALKSEIPTLPDLTPYALKSEVPVVGTAAKLDAGVPNGAATLDAGGKLVQGQVSDSIALKSDIPVVGTAAKLDAGVANGAATLDPGGKLLTGQVPDAVALKTELPAFATTDDATAGTRADVVMSPVDVVAWFNAKLPGDTGVALLGNNSWGLPDLSGYSGAIAGDGTGLYNLSAQRVNSPYGASIYDAGFGNWYLDGTLNANAFFGSFDGDGSNLFNLTALQLLSPYGNSIYDSGSGDWQVGGNIFANTFNGAFSGDGSDLSNVAAVQVTSPWGYSIYDAGSGNWQVNGGVAAGSFSGDGSSLSNLTAFQLSSQYGYSIYDSGSGNWQVNGGINANWFSGSFSGDGTDLYNLYANEATQLYSQYGYTIYDSGWGNWQVGGGINANWFNGSFSGDGSGLNNLYANSAAQINSPYGYSIYDAGWGSWQVNGNLYANSFNGDGSGLGNINASQLNSPYGYSIYDSGWGSWQVNGSMNGSFSGDGSGLYNINASQLNSPYGYSIYDAGWGNWQVNGGISASWFSGDGSGLSNINAEYAQYAYCDQYGNTIAYTYAEQWGYYGSMSVGNSDYSYSSQYSNYAYNDQWGCTLYGAGNVQWNFFGGSPNPGDVATFDGNYWSPAPGTPVPTTVATATVRFATGGLKTGWLVKQLDNRTVYQVLDPNDCATELGWVPVGPFILIPANSTPLVIDNTSPVLGTTIHCAAGTWSDNPTSYTYQWFRNGSPISSATALAYTVVAADDGASLQCVVSAINPAGTGTDSVTIPLVVLNAPVNTTTPAISPAGTPNVGDTLSLTGGAWTGFGYTTTYQWNRGGTAISGATAATYTLVAIDAGQAITCTVTRTNIRGTASVTTAATAAVTNLIAANTVIPTLSSTLPFTGMVLTCSPGTWNYHPASYSYQWKRSGVAISGATSSTYTVVSGDVGSTISCAVTATNAAGTSGAVSTAESSAVTAAAVSPIQGSIASGLIARWSLDEASGTRVDSINGINLTPYANGGTITNGTGKFGMAANIPPHSYLAVTDSRLATAKTLCGWFKLSAANGSYQRLLSGSIQVYGGSSGISWDPTHFSTGIIPTPGQWYFICLVSTGTSFKLWVNNQSFVVQSVTAGSPVLGSGFEIGDPSYESVAMLFDEVACWNRALSDAEIATLAAA